MAFKFSPEYGVAKGDTFSEIFPHLVQYIMENCEWQDCRDGKVKELLDFKTQVTNPYRRCTGGYMRDNNIFFLLAEAMWIATGRKDVHFLSLFNKQMLAYSDDGEVQHSPYGWRLRHWGQPTELPKNPVIGDKGFDQLEAAVRLLAANPNTRQVVMSIWDPMLDLGASTKDFPCNDMVMLKIRNGRLVTTIQNRSNDLIWGLQTNLFQFSFLSEIIALSLGIPLGTQTHNSQSLHIYDWNRVAPVVLEQFNNSGKDLDLYYGAGAHSHPIDLNYRLDCLEPVARLQALTGMMDRIINNLTAYADDSGWFISDQSFENSIRETSVYFYWVYKLLLLYLEYKKKLSGKGTEDFQTRQDMIQNLDFYESTEEQYLKDWDVMLLAKNFFARRLGATKENSLIGKL